MKIKTAIIDDDPMFTKVLEHYINKVDNLNHQGTFHTATEAINELDIDDIDLLFLDVEMPGLSGLEFLESMGDHDLNVVIVSVNREYGADAFDYDAIDYLHKPVSFARFLKAIKKAQPSILNSRKEKINDLEHFFIRCDGLWVRLEFKDVIMIKGDNNNVMVKTMDGDYSSPVKMKDISDQLPDDIFMKVHRSYIINLNKIGKVDGEVVEVGDRTVPVSRTHLKDLYDRLKIQRK